MAVQSAGQPVSTSQPPPRQGTGEPADDNGSGLDNLMDYVDALADAPAGGGSGTGGGGTSRDGGGSGGGNGGGSPGDLPFASLRDGGRSGTGAGSTGADGASGELKTAMDILAVLYLGGTLSEEDKARIREFVKDLLAKLTVRDPELAQEVRVEFALTIDRRSNDAEATAFDVQALEECLVEDVVGPEGEAIPQ